MTYQQFLSKIIREEIKVVLNVINKCINEKNLQVLLAIPYEKDMLWYKQQIEDKLRKKVAIISSSTKKQEREQIFEQYDKGEIDVIIGYKVLEKGVSIPQIGCLIDLYASATKENLEQLIGRLNRIGKNISKKYFFCFTRPLRLGKQHSLKKRILKQLSKKFKAKLKIITL